MEGTGEGEEGALEGDWAWGRPPWASSCKEGGRGTTLPCLDWEDWTAPPPPPPCGGAPWGAWGVWGEGGMSWGAPRGHGAHLGRGIGQELHQPPRTSLVGLPLGHEGATGPSLGLSLPLALPRSAPSSPDQAPPLPPGPGASPRPRPLSSATRNELHEGVPLLPFPEGLDQDTRISSSPFLGAGGGRLPVDGQGRSRGGWGREFRRRRLGGFRGGRRLLRGGGGSLGLARRLLRRSPLFLPPLSTVPPSLPLRSPRAPWVASGAFPVS